MKTRLRRLLLVGLSLVSAAALPVVIVACGSNSGIVTNGVTPDHLVLSSTVGGPATSTIIMYECFPIQLHAALVFSDGSTADYTNRVTWTSSDTGTINVESHSDSPLAGPFPIANGTVTPSATGDASITADYYGINAIIQVHVGEPADITIKRVIQGNTTDIPAATGPSQTATGFRMGVGTVEDMTVVALLDGVEQNIESTGVEWSFLQSNDGVATIDPATGHITGVAAGGPLIVKVGFASCSSTITDSATTTVTVADIQQIVTTPEYIDSSSKLPSQLIVGNAEKINVFADFGQGGDAVNGQDISTQTTLESSDPNSLAFATATPNFANAVAAGGPVNVTATFQAGGVKIVASDLKITTVQADLESIAVTALAAGSPVVPQALCGAADYSTQPQAAVEIGSSVPVQFCAMGTYNGGAITQDVTRVVTWTSSNPADATISNATIQPQLAGQALATAAATQGAVTITAASTSTTGNIAPTQPYQLGVNP